MLAVRYVALVALVLWIGALAGAVFGDVLRHTATLDYACGGVIVVSLFVMKFVGPPPHGFVPRVVITIAMLLLVVLSVSRRAWSPAIVPVTMALGAALLFWYVRE